eukprot:6871200-Prorocentrum_lima.AAC.1
MFEVYIESDGALESYSRGAVAMIASRVIITALYVVGEHPQHLASNMSLHQPTGQQWLQMQEPLVRSLLEQRGPE